MLRSLKQSNIVMTNLQCNTLSQNIRNVYYKYSQKIYRNKFYDESDKVLYKEHKKNYKESDNGYIFGRIIVYCYFTCLSLFVFTRKNKQKDYHDHFISTGRFLFSDYI